MPTSKMPNARPAKHGEKMIEFRVRFWIDTLSGEKDKVIPKHAWDSGVIIMESNEAHEITPASPQPFNSILDLTSVVAKVLMAHGVTLHANRKLRKLLQG